VWLWTPNATLTESPVAASKDVARDATGPRSWVLAGVTRRASAWPSVSAAVSVLLFRRFYGRSPA
jgi:hypothetical protein